MKFQTKILVICLWLGFLPQVHAGKESTVPLPPAPVIQCDEAVASFGEKTQDAIIQHVFVIWNRGNAPLEISGVKACCGATAEISDKSLAPGESASVAVVASLRGRIGPVERSIRIASNDAKQPDYLLQLVGSVPAGAESQAAPTAPPSAVQPVAPVQNNLPAPATGDPAPGDPATDATSATPGFISVSPAELHLAPSKDGSPLTQTLLIRSADNTSFQVTRIESPSADWTLDLRPVAPGLWRVKIQHIINGAKFDGQAIRIHTDSPDFAVLKIPVRWKAGAAAAPQESKKTKGKTPASKKIRP